MLLHANFIEERIRERQWSEFLTRLSVAAMVGIGFMGLILASVVGVRTLGLRREVARLQEEVRKYQEAAREYDSIQERIEALRPLLEPLENAHRGCESWWRLLAAIAENMPPGLWLSEVKGQKDANNPIPQVHIRGLAENHELVGEFALGLARTPWFSKVQITQAGERQGASGALADFTLVAHSRILLGVREYKPPQQAAASKAEGKEESP